MRIYIRASYDRENNEYLNSPKRYQSIFSAAPIFAGWLVFASMGAL
jgi:hypothetical protein